MSSISIDDITPCANCGKGEEAGSNLKTCTACLSVKYCSRECQIAHRPQHKKECRKRAAELHDEKLFKQPPKLYEDCPICFLPMPSLPTGSTYKSCCGKVICNGCIHAPLYDDKGNEVDNQKCPFCRIPTPYTDEEANKRLKKRMKAGDAQAMYNLGYYYSDGIYGYPQDYTKALELHHRAAELGCVDAYGNIALAYCNGIGVEVNMEKARHYYELGSMKGDPTARYNLGVMEVHLDNTDRALKHYMIAVRGGDSASLNEIKRLYSNGNATKDDYTKALQSYQEYLSEIKSDQRDKATAFSDAYKYY